ncbi:Hypothetical protein PENO1_109160 [Penicillium occitanis (nom. inval.)]|nr:hypothetical protein PENOC_110950 [Penicillium occitanis (nom. inval.)]PCG88626.1 Hypothetical protein PENO1_109160 [Penicillium occitanis (nom. inval.)]
MDTPIPSPGSHPSLISILTRRLQILNNEILSINETVGSGKLQLNQEEYTALEGASEDLGKRAKDIIDVVHALGKRRANAADGQKLLSTMKSIRADLKQSGKLKHRPTFIRNIQLIFEGPKESGLDSVPVKARKKLTHERCVQLRGLGTNGLILWSATFPPSQWDPNSLPKATFEYVLEFIDTKESQLWPEEIYDILSVLSKEEPLRNLPKFQEFFDPTDNLSEPTIVVPERKRRRTETSENERAERFQTDRQIQYMFSKAPSDSLLLLGDPLFKAVQASKQWAIDRTLEEARTGCITILIPAGKDEDISVNILVGRVQGLEMLNTFMMEWTWSASRNHESLQLHGRQEQHEPHPF